MTEILKILGFTSLTSTIWNLLAYLGMIMIIVAVVSKKLRSHFFVWGPLILFLYAWFFLHNPLLVGLQLVVTISGVLNLLGIKRGALLIILLLTLVVYILLVATGSIRGLWYWIGSFGILGMGFAFTQLPKKRGFVLITIGAILIVIYSAALAIWIWFILNIIFFVANVIELKRFKTI